MDTIKFKLLTLVPICDAHNPSFNTPEGGLAKRNSEPCNRQCLLDSIKFEFGGEWKDLKPAYQVRWVPCLGEGGRIYNQYLGGGTQMVTETTCVAEEHTPCIQWIVDTTRLWYTIGI